MGNTTESELTWEDLKQYTRSMNPEKRPRWYGDLPAHLLAPHARKQKEFFTDPTGDVWTIDPHKSPIGDNDYYRTLRRINDQGKQEEMRITESFMKKMTDAREQHERSKDH